MDKTIKFNLSSKSIDDAIRELRDYKNSVEAKTEKLRKMVAERIAELAQSGFNGAIVDDLTGEHAEPRMANVDVTVSSEGNITTVIANGEDAVWVEFGAGVHHNGAVGSSPNPWGEELGLTIGSYGHGNGRRQTWGFYEDGELMLTRGTPATMPMYTAVSEVCDAMYSMAKEVFG